MNIGGTSGQGLRPCSPWGGPQPKGEALFPNSGIDGVAFPPFDLTAGDNALFYFRIQAREADVHRAVASISSPDLYEMLNPHVGIRVEECSSPCLRDRLGPLIDEASGIASKSWEGEFAADLLREAVAALTTERVICCSRPTIRSCSTISAKPKQTTWELRAG